MTKPEENIQETILEQSADTTNTADTVVPSPIDNVTVTNETTPITEQSIEESSAVLATAPSTAGTTESVAVATVEKTTLPEAEMSFAEMLAEQDAISGKSQQLRPGERVTVKIVAITDDTVFVSTGSKIDGIVERPELEKDGELPYSVDDMIDLFVVSVSPHEIRLSTIVRGAGGAQVLEDAYHAQLPVEGKVEAEVKGGYSVEVMKRRTFCPFSQIDLHPLADAASVIGQIYPFRITRFESGGRNIVVSRRVILEEEQAVQVAELLKTIHVDDVVEARITRLAPFGAFAEIHPGVEGLIHISELGWSRVAQPDEVVSQGDVVRVKVLGIDTTEKGTRFSLSLKAVTDNPWDSITDRIKEGDTVSGKVMRTAPFGAFVEVLPGVEGLVHLSQFSYEKRIMKAEEMVCAGDSVAVRILEIKPDQKKMSLSIRDVAGNPWATVTEIIPLGKEITGTIESRAAFGMFISLAPGITGLLPTSVMQRSAKGTTAGKLGIGDAITVVVRNIDPEQRRISLALSNDDEVAGTVEDRDWKQHTPQTEKTSMGELGMALQAAMKDKKR